MKKTIIVILFSFSMVGCSNVSVGFVKPDHTDFDNGFNPIVHAVKYKYTWKFNGL